MKRKSKANHFYSFVFKYTLVSFVIKIFNSVLNALKCRLFINNRLIGAAKFTIDIT